MQLPVKENGNALLGFPRRAVAQKKPQPGRTKSIALRFLQSVSPSDKHSHTNPADFFCLRQHLVLRTSANRDHPTPPSRQPLLTRLDLAPAAPRAPLHHVCGSSARLCARRPSGGHKVTSAALTVPTTGDGGGGGGVPTASTERGGGTAEVEGRR